MSYAAGLAKQVFTSLGGESSLCQELSKSWGEETHLGAGQTWFAHFACFCDGLALLSQWRGYSRTRDGYALGFQVPDLLLAGSRNPNELDLYRVLYDEQSQVYILRSFLLYAQDLWDGRPLDDDGFAHGLLSVIGGVLVSVLLRFKHPKFEDEREWRILVQSPSDVAFRAATGNIVPFTTIQLDATVISRVVQGPEIGRVANRENVRRLLRASASADIVEDSIIPFSSL